MYNIAINKYVLYGMVVFSIIMLISIVLGFVAFIYHTKRMFDSIDKFNNQSLDKTNTYNNQIYKYNKNIKKCGIKRSSLFVSITKKIMNIFRD